MEAMYSPVKNTFNNMIRLGKNKKTHIIKGIRILQKDKKYEQKNEDNKQN